MASFLLAIPVVLEHEGVYSNLRGDPGGKTFFGFSTPFLRQHNIQPPQDEAQASALYQQFFWLPIYSEITSQNVATKVFDDHVNQGLTPAHENLQRALITVGNMLTVDGVIGDETLTAVNAADQDELLKAMAEEMKASYLYWISGDPQRQKFKHGLLNRAAWPWTPAVLAWT